MSINGITNPLLANLGAISRPDSARPDATRATTDRLQPSGPGRSGALAPVRPALKPQMPIAGVGTSQQVVPAEAPPGTDPMLWSVLTTDERNFFAKSASLGPLTYSRVKAAGNPTPPSARGVRLDVRA